MNPPRLEVYHRDATPSVRFSASLEGETSGGGGGDERLSSSGAVKRTRLRAADGGKCVTGALGKGERITACRYLIQEPRTLL